MSDPEPAVKKEAVWVVSNIGSGGTPDQRRATVERFDCIPGLCAALRTGVVKICLTALEACGAVLALGDSLCSADPTGTCDANPYVSRFEEHDIVDILIDLMDSRDDTVHFRASTMMDLYFDTDSGSTDLGSSVEGGEATLEAPVQGRVENDGSKSGSARPS
jgi:hypothetical protein